MPLVAREMSKTRLLCSVIEAGKVCVLPKDLVGQGKVLSGGNGRLGCQLEDEFLFRS